VSTFKHDGRAAMSAKQRARHDIQNDPIFSMSEEELSTWLSANARNPSAIQQVLKRVIMHAASLSK